MTRPASAAMLTLAFEELGLAAVNAWTVETNIPAQRVLEALHFRCIGRQRQCHYIDGRPLDRLLFDLLATEHRDVPHAGLEHTSATDLRPALCEVPPAGSVARHGPDQHRAGGLAHVARIPAS